jgi:hypothetical protein
VTLYYTILDESRRAMCEPLSRFKEEFYLAGGTGLALQCGHRISEDFDYFTALSLDIPLLLQKIRDTFPGKQIVQVQREERTLTLLVGGIKVSFFSVQPSPVLPLLDSKYFRIASVPEIGVFKLLALPRAAFKDYVDLYVILQQYSLHDVLILAKRKYPEIETSIYLKALLSYDDVDLSPIKYSKGFEVTPTVVFDALKDHVDRYLKEQ